MQYTHRAIETVTFSAHGLAAGTRSLIVLQADFKLPIPI